MIKFMKHKKMLVKMDFSLHAIFYSIALTWEGREGATCSCPRHSDLSWVPLYAILITSDFYSITAIFHNIATYIKHTESDILFCSTNHSR
jgi:hypothetical protein